MFIPGIAQSQLQTTKHDMNSPVLQHQLTTITASKMREQVKYLILIRLD
jgi:hypothetical protein